MIEVNIIGFLDNIHKIFSFQGDVGLTAGRAVEAIFTLGLTEAGYGIYKGVTNAGDGINHYFVEILYWCTGCYKSFIKAYQWWSNEKIVGEFNIPIIMIVIEEVWILY